MVKPLKMPEKYAKRVRALLDQIHDVESEYFKTVGEPERHASAGFVEYDDETRWKLHVAACSILDHTFWCRESSHYEGWYEATEVETGMTTYGKSSQEAMARYWAHDFDQPEELESRS